MAEHGEGQVPREDVEALLEVRRELGPEYDDALVESFVERIERAVAERGEGTRELAARADRVSQAADAAQKRAFTLGVVSLGTGIPITAIAGGISDLPGIIVAWLGIAGVNAAHAWAGFRK